LYVFVGSEDVNTLQWPCKNIQKTWVDWRLVGCFQSKKLENVMQFGRAQKHSL
jgi:uncharacterized pyridoxal phosphate-containing UPF0001 family protein